MKYFQKTIIVMLLLSVSLLSEAGDTIRYTLEQCHEMAIENGPSSRSREELLKAAELNRKAALAAMSPHVSANAAYVWNSRQAHLLANQTQFDFGTATVNNYGTASFEWGAETPLSRLADLTQGTVFHKPVMQLEQDAGQKIADAYQQVYNTMTVDLTHVMVAQVGVTQPIYTGGRLTAAYKIAKATENMANIESENKHDDIITAVDEAYWRVVSVNCKHRLADNYFNLLCKLENDVTELVNEGLATQSDLLKVRTKRGEAEVKRLQADNGLTLSRMALAQLCGLPLDEVFVLDESTLSETELPKTPIDAAAAASQRKELQLLRESEQIARGNARLAAAGLQPTIVASAGYMYTNPYAENGISSDWKGHGFFSAGVVMNIPIAHADDILRYKAAKHAANAVALQTEELQEKLTLQTTQANQRLMESQQKIALAQLTCNNAEEVLRMAQESFAAGMITASELMQAQTAWLAAATDLVDAETEAKVNDTLLRKYTGKL